MNNVNSNTPRAGLWCTVRSWQFRQAVRGDRVEFPACIRSTHRRDLRRRPHRQHDDGVGGELRQRRGLSSVPGSVLHTDGWLGYLPLESKGCEHEVTFLKGKKMKTPSELMPRVHRVISRLKRWLIGTHQGAVSHKHLDYYLDEFTFRF